MHSLASVRSAVRHALRQIEAEQDVRRVDLQPRRDVEGVDLVVLTVKLRLNAEMVLVHLSEVARIRAEEIVRTRAPVDDDALDELLTSSFLDKHLTETVYSIMSARGEVEQ